MKNNKKKEKRENFEITKFNGFKKIIFHNHKIFIKIKLLYVLKMENDEKRV